MVPPSSGRPASPATSKPSALPDPHDESSLSTDASLARQDAIEIIDEEEGDFVLEQEAPPPNPQPVDPEDDLFGNIDDVLNDDEELGS
jgi:hypothetical protein